MASATPCGRVVALLPSATATVCALGRQTAIVGSSHECTRQEIQHANVCTRAKVEGFDSAEYKDVLDACNAAASGLWLQLHQHHRMLLEFVLSDFCVDVDTLIELKPAVILTHVQGRALMLKLRR
ncbi:unnamed protein product [Ostreobium quekettii]|uniref:Fe/B12 periplasmic-binding domain-containing protein n=1 Tax=Ostreobium quekettii TaxID=121088 RepID=A0A8S1ITV2_9CHLO|nr:unnamed protein product [Ostreobium quekettii]